MEYKKLSEDQMRKLREHYQFMQKITETENKFNFKLSCYIFGHKEGERLWFLFAAKGQRSFKELSKCLTSEQKSDLFASICFEDDLFMHGI